MDPIHNFWTQFKAMNVILYLMEDIPQDLKLEKLGILSQALAAYHEDLGFHIRNSTPRSELIITAYGNPYLFKQVELLVSLAPKFQRWCITAFRQPENNLQIYRDAKDLPILFHGVSLKVSECYFKICSHRSKSHAIGIQVLLNNWIVFKDHPKFREAIDTLIEHLIGEKAFANKLEFIDIAQLKPEDIPQAWPLYQLHTHLAGI